MVPGMEINNPIPPGAIRTQMPLLRGGRIICGLVQDSMEGETSHDSPGWWTKRLDIELGIYPPEATHVFPYLRKVMPNVKSLRLVGFEYMGSTPITLGHLVLQQYRRLLHFSWHGPSDTLLRLLSNTRCDFDQLQQLELSLGSGSDSSLDSDEWKGLSLSFISLTALSIAKVSPADFRNLRKWNMPHLKQLLVDSINTYLLWTTFIEFLIDRNITHLAVDTWIHPDDMIELATHMPSLVTLEFFPCHLRDLGSAALELPPMQEFRFPHMENFIVHRLWCYFDFDVSVIHAFCDPKCFPMLREVQLCEDGLSSKFSMPLLRVSVLLTMASALVLRGVALVDDNQGTWRDRPRLLRAY